MKMPMDTDMNDHWSRRRFLSTLTAGVALSSLRPSAWSETSSDIPPRVQTGLDRLLASERGRLAGKRIGLLCNHTAVASDGQHAIEHLLADPACDLVALFAPEHGLKGRVIAGNIEDSIDEATGLPVWSLHGKHRKPTAEMLAGLDLLVVDLQDVGARFYTYTSTLALSMAAAGESSIPVLVLDRPNPIGGESLHGPLLDPAHASFLGMYPVPIRHGLTPGEYARLVHGEFGVVCKLEVLSLAGWTRDQYWPDTALPWIPPSPSLWRAEATCTYPGVCLFEGTNCSVGGSTYHPYEVVAAPWIDGEALAAALTAQSWPGVAFLPITYTPARPNDGKYVNEECRGVQLVVTDRRTFDPVQTGCAVLRQIHRTYGEKLTFRRPHMRLLAGSDTFLDTLLAAPALRPLVAEWDAACGEFDVLRQPYLLYPAAA